MTCPKCQSPDTAIVTHYTRRWSVMLFKDRRVAGDDVEREQVDVNRCLDCGYEWRDE
jgi:Zn ribbon nucleic-acid-binding protein